jgi:DNA-3-methyladenine glycosylase
MGSQLVPRDFFGRPSDEVAPDLLGCVLEHETSDGLVAVRLTEVEAYAGELDPASHAWRGRTARNAVMYGPPGHTYVYFTYGMHYCINLVCLPEGTASAVLLRAGAIVAGEALARTRRTASRPHSAAGSTSAVSRSAGAPAGGGASAVGGDRDLARGPARLCQALAIDRVLDGADACDPRSSLRIRRGVAATADAVRCGPRTGVSRGADIPWRFWLQGERTVSASRGPARNRLPTSCGQVALCKA